MTSRSLSQIRRRLYAALAAGDAVHPWACVPAWWQHMVRRVLAEAGMIDAGDGTYLTTEDTAGWVDEQEAEGP